MKHAGLRPTSRHGVFCRPWCAALLIVLCAGCGDPLPHSADMGPEPAAPAALGPLPDTQWVGLITRLSESGGYFDTDNLISNETSYLHVLGPMHRLGVQGGVYVGVGPDQSFSYMAQQRPELAFIVDIRRDNLLHHLLLKALFHEAERRVDYLALLFGRAVPQAPGSESPGGSGPDPWLEADAAALLQALAGAEGGSGSEEAREAWARLRRRIVSFGLPLEPGDLDTIEAFHSAFVRAGGALRFTSHGRPPRPYYPTFAQLLTETDLEGRRGSYMATEKAFRFLDALQEANRVVPVVGDLAGPSALRGIGAEARSRGLTVRALYTSNVESYLVRNGSFGGFAATLAELPVDRWSVLVRSVFPNAARHPDAVPGYYSTQTLVRLEDVQRALAGGGYSGFLDLVTRDAVPLLEPGQGADRSSRSPRGEPGRRP